MRNLKDYYKSILTENSNEDLSQDGSHRGISHGDLHDKTDMIYFNVRWLHGARSSGNQEEEQKFSKKLRRLGIDPEKIKTPEGWSYSHPEELGNFSFENIHQFKL